MAHLAMLCPGVASADVLTYTEKVAGSSPASPTSLGCSRHPVSASGALHPTVGAQYEARQRPRRSSSVAPPPSTTAAAAIAPPMMTYVVVFEPLSSFVL